MNLLTSRHLEPLLKLIPEIRFYPYVGEKYAQQEKKILVLANNRYCDPLDWDDVKIRTADPYHFADSMEEFTYEQKWYTTAFRNFIKGCLGIKNNFNANSAEAETVEDFIGKISYTNYINDFVITDGKTNVSIPPDQLERSRIIHERQLEILKPTYIVCWGKEVFGYHINNPRYEVVKSESLNKNGFGYAFVRDQTTGNMIHLLKTFHPSMPGFGVYNDDTHKLFQWFFKL